MNKMIAPIIILSTRKFDGILNKKEEIHKNEDSQNNEENATESNGPRYNFAREALQEDNVDNSKKNANP